MTYKTLCLVFLLSSFAVSCDDPWDSFSPNSYSFSDPCSGDPGDLSGIWEFRGEGRREACDQEFINTDSFMINSLELAIDHNVDQGTLQLGNSDFGDAFRLENGVVNGVCIEFTTIERVDRDSIQYVWKGTVENGVIRGDFTGDGPGPCETSGEFSVVR